MKNERKYGEESCEIRKQKGKRRMGRRECYTRFSRQEHEMLVDGIRKFGVGNWKRILCAYEFHEKRTAVDLKDKYRNILRAEERERSCGARRDDCEEHGFRRKTGTTTGADGVAGQGQTEGGGQGRVRSGRTECNSAANDDGGWERLVQIYGWESRMKGFHVTVSTSRPSDGSGDAAKSDVGERVEVCRPPAAMRLERLLCPAE